MLPGNSNFGNSCQKSYFDAHIRLLLSSRSKNKLSITMIFARNGFLIGEKCDNDVEL
jgi:hypothetical protein